MSIKESNEITVKIKCQLKDFYKIMDEKEFKIVDKFSMSDIYLVPSSLNLKKTSTRDILAKAVLVRDIQGKMSGRKTKILTFKRKDIDQEGNIIKQHSVNCNITDIKEAKKFIIAIGYIEIMNIKEEDTVLKKDDFEIAVKDIKNGDKLIEIETDDKNKKLDTIEKLKKKITETQIPIYNDTYFVKKAEIELNKILGRQ